MVGVVGHAVPVVQDLERVEDWSDEQIWECHGNTAMLNGTCQCAMFDLRMNVIKKRRT